MALEARCLHITSDYGDAAKSGNFCHEFTSRGGSFRASVNTTARDCNTYSLLIEFRVFPERYTVSTRIRPASCFSHREVLDQSATFS